MGTAFAVRAISARRMTPERVGRKRAKGRGRFPQRKLSWVSQGTPATVFLGVVVLELWPEEGFVGVRGVAGSPGEEGVRPGGAQCRMG